MFANSFGGEVVFLDEALSRCGRIPYDAGWIQDCTMLSDGRVLLNDVDNHVILEYETWTSNSPSKAMKYYDNWRITELVEIRDSLDARAKVG